MHTKRTKKPIVMLTRDAQGRFMPYYPDEKENCWCEIYGLVIVFCLICIVALQYTDKHMNEFVTRIISWLFP